MRRWIPLFLITGAFAFSAVVYPRLPERVPVHWNLAGQADGYSSRLFGALMLPIVSLATWAVLRLLPRLDPRGDNIRKSRAAYDLMVTMVVATLTALHVTALAVALGWSAPITAVVPLGIGLLFVVLGNVMPRVRSNFFFGIRTPWTLSSEAVWVRSHRVGGYVMVVAGLVIMSSALAPPLVSFAVTIGCAVGSAIAVTVYSYLLWKRERPAS